MATIDRPNTKALTAALDIYRDAMRPFIVRCLKRVPGMKVEEAIKQVLRDQQLSRFEQNLREGRKVEEAIDINDFQWLVRQYWREVFSDAVKPGSNAMSTLFLISDARNQALHPGSQDLDPEFVRAHLYIIAEALGDINAMEENRSVESIRDELFSPIEDTDRTQTSEDSPADSSDENEVAMEPLVTPAHRFRQGGRDVYAFSLDIETLDNVLPDRVEDRVVKDANRQLTPSHAKEIQRYLIERNNWLLGTLMLGISPDAVDFHSYVANPDSDDTVGELRINDPRALKIFDGQHRRRAIKDVLTELRPYGTHADKRVSLTEASLPIMLYVEGSIDALRQMFADAAQTRSIERNTLTRFDQRDAFNHAALWIAENSDLFAGRTEMERPSVARSSHNIIAINQLAASLKTLEVGYQGRVSKDRNSVYMLDLESLYERCLTWADDFMPTARAEYNDLMAGEVDNSEIPQERTKTMAYNATVIRILAGCYYEWLKESADWTPLAEFIRNASLEPGRKEGTLLIQAGVVAPGGISPAAQLGVATRAIEYIVQQAKASVD